MTFTFLIINFLQVHTFQHGPVPEKWRERGRRKRAWETKAEGRMSARNTSSALPNTKTGLSLSRLSLASYFIPFVIGTGTELQRRLQWAHQSPPTDCGPTDTLEVGINFFVENVEKAATMCWNNSMFCPFVFFSCLPVVLASAFFSGSLHVEGSEGQDDTLFSSDVRLGRFPSFSCVSGFFFCFFLSFFLQLLWQALLEFSPYGSGQKSMPTCVFSCSSLFWWRLEKRDRWENLNQLITDKIFYKCASVSQVNKWIIKCEILSWLFLFCTYFCPRCLFWPLMDGAGAD